MHTRHHSRGFALTLAMAAAALGPDLVVNAMCPRVGKTVIPPTQHSDERVAAAEAKRSRKNAKRARETR